VRILMTADTLGGVWTYAMELGKGLAAEGHEVSIAAMGGRMNTEQRAQSRGIPGLEARDSAFKLEWMEDPWDDVARAGDWLLEAALEARAEIIHLNGFVHAALPWEAPVLVTGHSCVLSWWRAVKGGEAPPSWDRYRQAVTEGLRRAQRVTAPTAAIAAEFHRLYACGPKTTVIPNGRDAIPFRSGIKRGIVMGAGRLWDEAKNLGLLERIASDLPWPIQVAGDTAAPQGNARETAGIKPLGRLAEAQLAEALGIASVFAHPARYEPFGYAPLEAALSRCALVLGDIPSLREVWDGAALFAPPDDTDAWLAVLRPLLADENALRTLAGAAWERAQLFSRRAMADAYQGAYTEMRKAAVHAG
jgi:glycogen(starch) synthase